jgi:hypothetical protein
MPWLQVNWHQMIFKEYFRGLYFKMEKSGSSAGNTAMLNFKADENYNKIRDLSTTVGAVTTVTRVKNHCFNLQEIQ